MKEKNWFEEWFDSPYYHLLYNNRDDHEAEDFISRVVKHLRISKGARVLDVACGKGRHSRMLAKHGIQVTGIDLSYNSIAFAKQFENANLEFEEWDMRHVYRKNEFNFVFNLFSSFGYFETEQEDKDCLQAFAANLKPGGILVLDYLNTEYVVKHMKSRDIIQRGEVQFHLQKKIEGGFIKKKIDFLAEGENHHYEEQLQVINRLKFEEMLTGAGFEIKEIFGDYTLHPFEAVTSPRLVLIAQKHA